MCRATLQTNKLSLLSLSKPTSKTEKRQRAQTQVHNSVSKKAHNDSCERFAMEMTAEGLTQYEPTVLDFMSVIGERQQHISNNKLKTYTDQDFLKISQQWSRTLMKYDGEYSVIPSLFDDDESDMSSPEMILSLNEECARLEVSAVAVLASLEHEMNKSSGNINTQYHDGIINQDWLDEDDGIYEESHKLEEAMESLEEELNDYENMDIVRNKETFEDEKEWKAMIETHIDASYNMCSIAEEMIETKIMIAPCA